MPVSSTGVITAAKPLNTLDGQVSGVVRQVDFAVCDNVNPGTQLQFSTANISAGTSVVLTAPSVSGAVAVSGTAVTQYVVPLTGATVVVAATTDQLLIDPAGTILALTVTFPAGAAGKTFTLATTQIVTGLTLGGAGGDTILGALTAGVANGFASYTYSVTGTKWIRTG